MTLSWINLSHDVVRIIIYFGVASTRYCVKIKLFSNEKKKLRFLLMKKKKSMF